MTDSCAKFMHGLDWDRIGGEARRNFVSYFDVSSSLELFPHLRLDENYELFCYITYEYHGLWGRVAAVGKDADHAPAILEELGILYGPRFELPGGAVPPMEALYNDGTPYGYFEAILAKEFYLGLPYVCFERKNWGHCIAAQPKDLKQNWRVLVDIPDFTPRLCFSDDGCVSINAFWREYENGIGSSDGKDCIYLRQHSMESSLSDFLLLESLQGRKNRMYRSHIQNNGRYCKARRCCVSTETSIQIAVERHPGL